MAEPSSEETIVTGSYSLIFHQSGDLTILFGAARKLRTAIGQTCAEMSSTDHVIESPPAPSATDPAANAFSMSMVVSGIRCLLTYILFPWLLPVLGLATGIGPVIGLVVGTIAIGFNVASIRRLSRSEFRWRHQIIAVNVAVIVLLLVLVGLDIADLA